MSFLALGVEHKTAPLSVREQIVVEGVALREAYSRLAAEPSIDEVAILSTCNRTEIYLFVNHGASAAAATGAYLGRNVDVEPFLQVWKELDVAEHLFRVASGLESQLLGEAQILSQVRDVLQAGQQEGTIGPNLHALFRAAVSCARHARGSTRLGRNTSSLATEAVALAEQELQALQGRSVLVIGAGEVSKLAITTLQRKGLKRLYIANRTESVAKALASECNATAVAFGDLPDLLSRVDVVFSATASLHYVLGYADFDHAQLRARGNPLYILDLAIPRDIDPEVGTLPQVRLHDLDDLGSGAAVDWDADIQQMEAAIGAQVADFSAWYLTRRVVPLITHLRSHVEGVSRQELKRVEPRLVNLSPEERRTVETLTQRLIDKMFHHLVTRLRLAAQTDPKLVEAAEFLFLHGEGGLFEYEGSADETIELTQ